MGLANDNTYGSKGSNFNYQLRMLKLLGSSSLIAGNIQTLVSPTYSYSASIGYGPPINAAFNHDIFQFTSSNVGRIIRIRKITFQMTSTTPTVLSLVLLKRSTRNTLVWFPIQQATKVAHSSTNPTSYLEPIYYAAQPSGFGTFVGQMKEDTYETTATGTVAPILEWVFGQNGEQLPEIHTLLEGYYISVNGHVAIPGVSAKINIEWDELPV